MSFSRDVKEELSKQLNSARHCQIAELSALISLCGKVIINEKDKYILKIQTENICVARKYFTLIRKTFNINTENSIRQNLNVKKGAIYTLTVLEHDIVIKILHATKLMNEHEDIGENLSIHDNLLIQNGCCKRAFIRGVFLASGSISDPEKTYHFEIVVATEQKAKQIQDIINSFAMDSKVIKRKKNYFVYVKEASQIVDLLNIM